MKYTVPSVLLILLLTLSSSNNVAVANTPFTTKKSPVDITLFVMSRCPDAVKCEGTFSKVFQIKDLPAINPSLSFIGAIERVVTKSTSRLDIEESTKSLVSTSASITTTKVTCKHGPLECAGNTQQLCFKKYFPDHQIWVPYVVALNSLDPRRIGEPEYASEVAKKIVGDDNDNVPLLRNVKECSESREGFDLLVESVQNTIDHGVSTSCTVFIEGKKRCVVDGGVWRECPGGSSVADFVRSIKEAASRLV
ncbi:hypothetical protein BGZ49_003563, partial [Haplosporangium sp. Z 27]